MKKELEGDEEGLIRGYRPSLAIIPLDSGTECAQGDAMT